MTGLPPGVVPLQLAQGLPVLHPEELVWVEMLNGWCNQQLGRNLSFTTIDQRIANIERFRRFTEKYPWHWEVTDMDDFSLELRGVRGVSHSTMLNYQGSVRLFMEYVTDSSYGWAEECLKRFGTHPAQIAFEWNTARHREDSMGGPKKRPYTREELQVLFDCADNHVVAAQRSGHKGWAAWFRLATMMKTAYAWGLRRNEVRQLELADFGRNPAAKSFRGFGMVYVRHGKAKAGSPPKHRTVVTVPQADWAVDCLRDWIDDIRPRIGSAQTNDYVFPSERNGAMTADALSRAFTVIRREAGLGDGLDFHSLRRSYVTHLIEDGYDAFFVQQQVGHEHGSTTSIYTGVSPDYRNRVVQQAFNQMAAELGQTAE
ncbi:phage integrase family protein [Arthrobacter sp. BL-252-APC-1A]|nr:phage integrase family protein [Arthrobacter sp. BL-252-APC-1A]